MKRIIAAALAIIMVALTFGLSGCGKKDVKSGLYAKNNASVIADGVIDLAEREEETEEDYNSTLHALNKGEKSFIMGIDPEYIPFTYIGEGGEYTGFDVEVCKAVCEHLGWNFEIFAFDFDQLFYQLNNYKCDCVWTGITITDERKELGFVFSNPYYDGTQVFIVKDDSAYESFEDLEGETIAVQFGSSGELFFSNNDYDAITYDSFRECITELNNGSVDAVVANRLTAEKYADEHEGFRVIDNELGADQYGIAFRPEDAAVCEAIDGALAELVEDGTYAEIAKKYPDIANDLIYLSK